ncbi:MAG: 7-cyano-7-deazaguanine synthase QueC [Candidatus Heimdallarchaeota archaeon]|nr:7-cyano-7-deazaguanine synthase QueC [Candidatus Heimdallarchaeota archaeon]
MSIAIVLFSGGLDSTACLYWALEKYDRTILLSFLYGSKEDYTISKINSKFSSLLNLESKIIELPFLDEFTKNSGSTLSQSGNEVPEINNFEQLDSEELTKQTAKSVWVPGRNILFISIAASYADSLDTTVGILFGANEEEASTFSDNTTEFVERMNDSIELGCMNDIEVIAPFHEKQKSEIVEFLKEKDALIEFSSSCYQVKDWTKEGHPIHCGICESCQRRKRAFQIIEKEDTTRYQV